MPYVAAALAAALAAAPVTTAAEPASDEYTFELPGARDGVLAGTGPARGVDPPAPIDQAGVAGETASTPSPFESAVSTISDSPLALAVALACGLLAGSRLRQPQIR